MAYSDGKSVNWSKLPGKQFVICNQYWDASVYDSVLYLTYIYIIIYINHNVNLKEGNLWYLYSALNKKNHLLT